MDRNWQFLARRSGISALVLCAATVMAGCSYVRQIPLPSFLKTAPPPPEMPMMADEMRQPDPDVEPEPVLPPDVNMAPPEQMASRMSPRRPPVRRPPAAKPPVAAAPKEPPKEAAPPVQPAELVGSDYSEVLKVLRRPDSVQNSALTVVWNYAETDCRLQLFFYPDIKTSTFHLLRFDLKNAAGEKVANSNPCMQQFMVSKNDGTSSQQ